MECLEIPLFPLHAVLFPGGILPLRIFEQRYIDMVKQCLQDDALFGICLIKAGNEVGTVADPEPIGCLAKIIDWDMRDNMLYVKVRGVQRFRILEQQVNDAQLLTAKIVKISVEPPQTLPSGHLVCAKVIERIIEQIGERHFELPAQYHDAVWVGYRLAEILPLKLIAKQQMLQMNDSITRIQVLHKFLQKQGLAI